MEISANMISRPSQHGGLAEETAKGVDRNSEKASAWNAFRH